MTIERIMKWLGIACIVGALATHAMAQQLPLVTASGGWITLGTNAAVIWSPAANASSLHDLENPLTLWTNTVAEFISDTANLSWTNNANTNDTSFLGNNPLVNSSATWGATTNTATYGTNGYWNIAASGSQYLSAADRNEYDFTTNFTVYFWVKTTSDGKAFVSHFNTGAPYAGFEIGVGNIDGNAFAHKMYCYLGPLVGTGFFGANGTTIDNGVWHFCAVTVDSGAKVGSQYVDGIFQLTQTNASLNTSSTSPLYLGRDSNASPSRGNMNGSIDALTLLNTNLSSNNIYTIYYNTKGRYGL